jgi:hypothetical protein
MRQQQVGGPDDSGSKAKEMCQRFAIMARRHVQFGQAGCCHVSEYTPAD